MRVARRRPVVVFLDHTGWDCFLQLAGALRRAGARALCVRLDGGRSQYLLWRLGYGSTLRADRPRDVRRLTALARRGRIVDLQLSESAAAVLGRTAAIAEALGATTVPGGRRHWTLLDKLEVSRRLSRAEVPVPPMAEVEAGVSSNTLARLADDLGYPVVVKRRVDTAGLGVAIAGDADAVLAAAERLGTGGAGIFLERFIAGDIVQYAAMVGANGIEQGDEVCLLVEKAPDNPLGPSVSVTVIEDGALVLAGRRAVSALGCTGLVNLEFVRDQAGTAHHIDCSTRAFGNLAAVSMAGVDLIGAYIAWLGLRSSASSGSGGGRIEPGARLNVYPSVVKRPETHGRTSRLMRRVISESGPYLRRFGLRYVLVTLVLEMQRARDRRRAALAIGAASRWTRSRLLHGLGDIP